MTPAVKSELENIHHAETRANAVSAVETFREKYGVKYAPAVTCLIKDIGPLLAFYDFPAEHWDHLRTSNPVESVFATVRHRTVRTKGALSQKAVKLMVFKLVQAPSNGRRQNPASRPESDDRRSPKEAPSAQPFLISYPWSLVISLIGRLGVQPKSYRRTSMAARQPARAPPELRKAPLSPRYTRNYTTPWGTTYISTKHMLKGTPKPPS